MKSETRDLRLKTRDERPEADPPNAVVTSAPCHRFTLSSSLLPFHLFARSSVHLFTPRPSPRVLSPNHLPVRTISNPFRHASGIAAFALFFGRPDALISKSRILPALLAALFIASSASAQDVGINEWVLLGRASPSVKPPVALKKPVIDYPEEMRDVDEPGYAIVFSSIADDGKMHSTWMLGTHVPFIRAVERGPFSGECPR